MKKFGLIFILANTVDKLQSIIANTVDELQSIIAKTVGELPAKRKSIGPKIFSNQR
jgi:hypothetical protein